MGPHSSTGNICPVGFYNFSELVTSYFLLLSNGNFLLQLFYTLHTIIFWVYMKQISCLFSLQVFRSRSEPKKPHGTSSKPGLDLDVKILDFEPEFDAMMGWDFGGVFGRGKYIYIYKTWGRNVNIWPEGRLWQFKITSTDSLAFFPNRVLCSFSFKCMRLWLL